MPWPYLEANLMKATAPNTTSSLQTKATFTNEQLMYMLNNLPKPVWIKIADLFIDS